MVYWRWVATGGGVGFWELHVPVVSSGYASYYEVLQVLRTDNE